MIFMAVGANKDTGTKTKLTDLFAVGFGLGFLHKNIANDEKKY